MGGAIACALIAAPPAIAGPTFPADSGYPYLTTSDRAASLAVAGTADFNADGHDDLLLLGKDHLATSPGDGRGGFGSITKRGPDSVDDAAIADFNGDGVPDLATAAKSGASVEVTVSLNLGDGRFGSAATVTLPADSDAGAGYYAEVGTGDYDGDGDADVTVRGSQSIASLRWDSGTLLPPVETAVPVTDGADGAPPRTLTPRGPFASGDLNEDGLDDVVVERQDRMWGHDDLVTLLGLPDGTFAVTLTSPGTGGSDDFTLVDLDSDGHLDLIGSGYNLIGSHANVNVAYGTGTAGFEAPIGLSDGADGYLPPVVADFDGDGDADVTASLSQRWIRVFERTGPRSFAAPLDEGGPATVERSTGLTGGDFNEDGWPDVAVSRDGHILVQLNRLGPHVREQRPAFEITIRSASLAGSVGRLGRTPRIGGTCSVRCAARLTFRLPVKAKRRTGMKSPVLATARVHWQRDPRTTKLRLHRPALRSLRSYRGSDLKVLVIARGVARAPTAPGSPRRGGDRKALQLRAG